ncbi:tetratricopeptide repeat protein [Streptomyces sp. NPDC001536]|uniref:tetratricopeptide repeat protein n=1 Tax=Streptomyces sp. NPDC001536 TaxID=3364583 RepID=UPI0036AABD35
MRITWPIRGHARAKADIERLNQLWDEDKFEEVEAEARELEARAASPRGDSRRVFVGQYARFMATSAACALGRGAHVLHEMEALAAELHDTAAPERLLLDAVRANRLVVLNAEQRYGETEAEAAALLGELTRVKHLMQVMTIELFVLANLADALCGQGRHTEAETIVRGNLPRAQRRALASLHCGLVESLNGQGRHDEALTEARRFAPPRVRAQSGRLTMATAVALRGLGRRSEAEAAARQAVADCERHLDPEHPRLRQARTLLTEIEGAAH